MPKRLVSILMGLLLALFISSFLPSCAKKVVQREEAVKPSEARLMEKPPEVAKPPEERKPPEMVTRPLEEEKPVEVTPIPEEERKRKAEEEAFVNEDIHFDFDKYDLKPRAREILADKARFLKKYPNVKVLIEGHCDERGTNEYNLALGERRANSAKKYLITLGIDPKRLSTISYGEERPIDPRHNEEAWAKNRRAHFVIISR